jgi:hypothetical protein
MLLLVVSMLVSLSNFSPQIDVLSLSCNAIFSLLLNVVVCTERTIQGDRGDESVARVLFFEENRFQLIGSFDLDYLETALSITTINFEGNSRPYIAVGTAQVINDELEPSKGRIIIFDINEEKKINVITDKETKAGVYSLVEIQGRLAAGVGSKVSLKPFFVNLIC